MNQDDKLKVNYIKKDKKYTEKGNLAIIIPPKSLKIPHAIQIFPQYPAPDRWVLVSISEIAKLMREEEDENFISNVYRCELFIRNKKNEINDGILIFKSTDKLLVLNFEENPSPFLKEAHKFFTRKVRLDIP